ncbi:hypothetical protein RhiirA4_486209 [Rhizophagus irregularis]|uniref:Uncharacterized protein n=1 Tax=Rhizophagus irregularis TaxID=588596 RepID=A0A2I1HR37_9GLOM|nr:hypothetical protein RhiirA4_486209 [Rhizophagus irregularis]
MLLYEYKYELLYKSSEVGIQYFGFITPFFDILKSNKEIIVDATYKTNALGFELYAIMGQFDGAGFSMAYLFVDNSKKNNGARTEILKGFFQSLYDRGLNNIQFFLTDKDFSQITASQNVWSTLKKRLSDNTLPKTTTYSSSSANENFSFIDIEFYPSNLQVKKSNFVFCPKDLRQNIILLFEKHLHLHPLIPNINGNFLISTEIWKVSVEEMYNFCFTNDLRHVWA